MILRKAGPSDVDQLVALMAEFYAEAPYPLNHQRAAEAFAALVSDDRNGHAWLIRADSKDVGHVVITLCFSMEYGDLIAFVDDLFVQKGFRGIGLATSALREVLAFCVNLGIRAVFVETGKGNVAAQTVYRRVGFTNTDRQLLALQLASATHET